MKTFITIILLLTSKSIFAQDWVYAGESVTGDKYYLRKTANSDYGNKKAWSKRIGKSISYKKGNKTFTLLNGYCLELSEYDCSGRQTKLISFAYYNSKGSVVYSYNFQPFDTDWEDVFPDSMGETLLVKVCELF